MPKSRRCREKPSYDWYDEEDRQPKCFPACAPFCYPSASPGYTPGCNPSASYVCQPFYPAARPRRRP